MNDDYDGLKELYILVQEALVASYIKNDKKEAENIVKKMDDLIYKNYTEQIKKSAAKFANKAWLNHNAKLFKEKND